MNSGVIDIGYLQLLLAGLLILITIGISIKMKLGQSKNLIIGAIRTFVQLLALGFILNYVFALQSWWIVLLVVLFMIVAATQIAVKRVDRKIPNLWPSIFISLFFSSVIVALLVVEGVIQAEPWYSARHMIPISSMIIGNAMTAVALAINRLFDDLEKRKDELDALVALGASPFEAALPSIKHSINAGMLPTIAMMSAVGIVSIPGMMSGQILAGADPLAASKYQIVVVLMQSAASALAVFAACYFSYSKSFSKEGYYIKR